MFNNEFFKAALREGYLPLFPSKSSSEDDTVDEGVAHAFIIEMANLGFLIKNPDNIKSVDNAKTLVKILEATRNVVGADRNMKPIYPGFPAQVKSLSTMTLLVEQILHYISGGTLIPDYPDVVRKGLPLKDMLKNAKTVVAVNTKDIEILALDMLLSKVASNVSASDNDVVLIENAIKIANLNTTEAVHLYSQSNNGENKTHFARAYFEIMREDGKPVHNAFVKFTKHAKNSDQLLKLVLAVYTTKSSGVPKEFYNDAIIHLDSKKRSSFRFTSMNRPARRAIMAQLGNVTQGYKADKLISHMGLWRAVLRTGHFYELNPTTSQRRALDIVTQNIEHQTLESVFMERLNVDPISAAELLLDENAQGLLVRRLVMIMRAIVNNGRDVDNMFKKFASVVEMRLKDVDTTTLISAYNGLLVANDDSQRIIRVAGKNNSVVSKDVVIVPESNLDQIKNSLKELIKVNLRSLPAPSETVNVVSEMPFPLVVRDASLSDQKFYRGEVIDVKGDSNVLRLFSYWKNNSYTTGYIDLGAAVLDDDFDQIAACDWSTWRTSRDFATYSGDKNVHPGGDAVEFIDVELDKLKNAHPSARWIVMSLQSWSGIRYKDVDIIAGVMHRSDADAGENFDARTVSTAFTPTTEALESLPLAYDILNGTMTWLDSSSGSTKTGMNILNNMIPVVLKDELRPRMTIGEVASLWAEAHEVDTVQEKADAQQIIDLIHQKH